MWAMAAEEVVSPCEKKDARSVRTVFAAASRIVVGATRRTMEPF